MKKKTTRNCLLMLLTMSCATLSLVGCKNKDYDFDKVDYALGFGGDKVSLPSDNSVNIVLDDLLDIDNSELISADENGNYMFGKNPDPIDPVMVTINPITMLAGTTKDLSIGVNVPAAVQSFQNQEIDVEGYGMNVEGKVAEYERELNAPKAVRELDVIGLGGNGEELTVNIDLPVSLISFTYVNIDLPDNLVMTWENQSISGSYSEISFDETINRLRIEDYQTAGHLTLRFNVTGIRNGGQIGTDDYVVFTPAASEEENGHIAIKGTVSMSAKVKKLKVPAESQVVIGGQVKFDNLDVTKVTGKFDPDIHLSTAGTVNITSIPKFLTDEEVVADLDNPQIWLTLRSTMPLDGLLQVQLKSDTYQEGIVFNNLRVKKSLDGETETETNILLCRHVPEGNIGTEQVITNDNLSKLVNKLEEGMKIEFSVLEAKAVQETGTVLLGHEYHLTPSYRFSAPLAFGPNAVIVYTKTEDGWHDDIKDLTLSKGSYIHVTGTAVNQIPANLQAEVTPIDVNGSEIPELKVELIQASVKGTKGTAVESPIEARIEDPNGTGIKKLDGISFKLKASSNEELRGVTLNKTSQTLRLKDISVDLIGKIIYDAN